MRKTAANVQQWNSSVPSGQWYSRSQRCLRSIHVPSSHRNSSSVQFLDGGLVGAAAHITCIIVYIYIISSFVAFIYAEYMRKTLTKIVRKSQQLAYIGINMYVSINEQMNVKLTTGACSIIDKIIYNMPASYYFKQLFRPPVRSNGRT